MKTYGKPNRYPFNWQEFHAWKNKQPKRYAGNGKQTVFKMESKDGALEIKSRTNVSSWPNTLHHRDCGNGVVVLFARAVL